MKPWADSLSFPPTALPGPALWLKGQHHPGEGRPSTWALMVLWMVGGPFVVEPFVGHTALVAVSPTLGQLGPLRWLRKFGSRHCVKIKNF